jgi:hypothetical protein
MPPGKGRQSRGCSPLGQAQGISLVTTQNPQRAKRGHPRGRTLRENGNRPTRCDRPAEYNCSITSERTQTDPPAKPTRKWTEQDSPRMEKRKGRRTWRHRANFRRSIAAIRSSRTCIRLVPKKRATFELMAVLLPFPRVEGASERSTAPKARLFGRVFGALLTAATAFPAALLAVSLPQVQTEKSSEQSPLSKKEVRTEDGVQDRKSTRLNSSHDPWIRRSRMPSSA